MACPGVAFHLEIILFNFSPLIFCVSLRGFTKFNRNDYVKFKSEGKIQPDGVNAKVILTSTCK